MSAPCGQIYFRDIKIVEILCKTNMMRRDAMSDQVVVLSGLLADKLTQDHQQPEAKERRQTGHHVNLLELVGFIV